MNKKKKMHPVLKILLGFFIVYIALYIASESGYYEGKIRQDTALTEEGIQEFEEKLQNGEAIDLEAFLNNERVDYSNPVSKLGDKFTDGIETLVEKSSKIVTDIIKTLF